MRIFTKQSEKSDREMSAQVRVFSYDCSPPDVYKPHILKCFFLESTSEFQT